MSQKSNVRVEYQNSFALQTTSLPNERFPASDCSQSPSSPPLPPPPPPPHPPLHFLSSPLSITASISISPDQLLVVCVVRYLEPSTSCRCSFRSKRIHSLRCSHSHP
ncbi:uncharacterized protein SEPMUDRAFT_122890 [Sphaerulina musiva SO2202]|uniref:Uncharacterized protein n=1 Tax=Sphaerulina musiva (strain SO2202) TaxID=692275 RepID=N1QJY0_SPHMS|nr:uncharacterized protein SEPMUDRAFT_122890 [Sphaerulina musiva SO2202]EMF17541.1 hypothetical protein SEPMUDRAFT_122890 [Sphaerulina musiva SO2202]